MDWLGKYKASTDCAKKTIVLKLNDHCKVLCPGNNQRSGKKGIAEISAKEKDIKNSSCW